MSAHTPIPEVQWKARQHWRQGWPVMSIDMLNALIRLYNGAIAGAPFQPLAGLDARTVRAMERHDWIFASRGIDGSLLYKITGRGERAMQVYRRPARRTDGICPTCGQRPKRIRRNGVQGPYCTECDRASNRRKAQLGLYRTKPGRLCSACRQKPVRQFPGGKFATYCEKCLREKKRAEKRLKLERLRARLDAGEFVKCCRRGCPNPVHRTSKSILDVCEAHYKAYHQQYRDRRRPNSQAARRRRYARTAS